MQMEIIELLEKAYPGQTLTNRDTAETIANLISISKCRLLESMLEEMELAPRYYKETIQYYIKTGCRWF